MPYDRSGHTFSMDWNDLPEYRPGYLYLGEDRGIERGYPTRNHAITVGGPRSGKGVGYIIPNLLRWPENVLCIDPKGENVEAAWLARYIRGHKIRVLDPFHEANIHQALRAKFNPLSRISLASPRYREDIRVLTDGLIIPSNEKDAHWDSGAKTILAGLIAFVIEKAPPEKRTLPEVRRMLMLTGKDMQGLKVGMSQSKLPMVRSAFASLSRKGNETDHFLSSAQENTSWLDSEPVAEMLSSSTFDLDELRTGKTDVFLVLPPDLLVEHGRFLRLFVRCALNSMSHYREEAERTEDRYHRCLFLLDEFAAMGKIEEIISSGLGLMPGYGVTLWPFLHDLGQLVRIYGKEGAETFFACSDVQIFFGMMDSATPEYVSRRFGPITHDDLGMAPSALQASSWYAIPPDAQAVAQLGPVVIDMDLMQVATQGNVPEQIPHFHSQKSPAVAWVGNAIMASISAAAHEEAMTRSNRARMALQLLEQERQLVYSHDKARYETAVAMAKAEYEQNLRRQLEIEKELKRGHENEKAVVAHALTLVGKPRLTADMIRIGTAKETRKLPGTDKMFEVARAAIVFTPEGGRIARLKAYFEEQKPGAPVASASRRRAVVKGTTVAAAKV